MAERDGDHEEKRPVFDERAFECPPIRADGWFERLTPPPPDEVAEFYRRTFEGPLVRYPKRR